MCKFSFSLTDITETATGCTGFTAVPNHSCLGLQSIPLALRAGCVYKASLSCSLLILRAKIPCVHIAAGISAAAVLLFLPQHHLVAELLPRAVSSGQSR